MDRLDTDILAGTPFLTSHDIALRTAKKQITIRGGDTITYGSYKQKQSSIRRTQAYLLRAPQHTVIMPGQYLELSLPVEANQSSRKWALEPRLDAPTNNAVKIKQSWPPPQEIASVGSILRVTNNTEDLIAIKRHEHFCQVHPITAHLSTISGDNKKTSLPNQPVSTAVHAPSIPHCTFISLDPDNMLSPTER